MIRFAEKGDVDRLKEIWKLSFGDDRRYIDFYFSQKYQEKETLLLLEKGQIAAMLTMLPIKLFLPGGGFFKAAMLYAIATHPDFRNRQFASQLILNANFYLARNEFAYSMLVPDGERLIDFYRQRGYQEGFFLREATLTHENITESTKEYAVQGMLMPAKAEEYNRLRDSMLYGRMAVCYEDSSVAYQKKLSINAGADIYSLKIAMTQGCAVIERISEEFVLVKELLVREDSLQSAIRLIASALTAKKYLIRTPAFSGQSLKGRIRSFGMIKSLQDDSERLSVSGEGYLGLAFD